ncbi:MAG TPA: HemK/PrmC family methyltransferase [Candidatus Azoamicus sp. OHIO1]
MGSYNKCIFLNKLFSRSVYRIPVTFVVGYKNTHYTSFLLSYGLLIPRQETIELVDILGRVIKLYFICTVIDLGTGSGILGVSLLNKFTNLSLLLTDRFKNILFFTIINVIRHKLRKLKFICCNWYDFIPYGDKFDLIISNPPYVSMNEYSFFVDFLTFEKKHSLISFEYGLSDLYYIIKLSYHYLNNNGCIFFEHGYLQSKAIRKALRCSGLSNICTYNDYFNLSRITFSEK